MSVFWNALRLFAFVAIGLLATNPARAVEAVKSWEVDGLDAPECARLSNDRSFFYVSNVAGSPLEKDGNGFISKVSIDGSMLDRNWVTGLNAPKGIALVGDRLFVADIDELVEIDTTEGKIVAKHQAPGAKLLNDVAARADGIVFVSDTFTNTIWRLVDGEFEAWLKDDALNGPNGLFLKGSRLIVASFGTLTESGETDKLGHLVLVSLRDKSVKKLGNAKPTGHLDGVEPLDGNSYLVTDWKNGGLYHIATSGITEKILPLEPGSGDLAIISEKSLAVIPMMNNNKLVAYELK